MKPDVTQRNGKRLLWFLLIPAVLATCAEARRHSLSVVSGLCLRYSHGYRETIQRIQRRGVGLGLAITERAVRFHGGKVSASNRTEGGLVVEIRLPLIAGTVRTREIVEAVPLGRA